MKNSIFDVILLIALPASGKSEVRHFLANTPADRLRETYHIGETLQLDDFPYVFMMRRIDEELEAMDKPRIFYPGETPFIDGRDWGTLIRLLNEDYHDLYNRNVIRTDSAAKLLFDRIDRASLTVGLPARIGKLPEDIRNTIARKLEPEARKMLDEKQAAYPESFENKTLIIECARGGPVGAEMPLTGTNGYQYTLPQFCPEILEKAAILYIWVTPEESRRKNADRADPNDPGSNLHHSTPEAVMLADYGCDDIEWLVRNSPVPNTVEVTANGITRCIPIGIFDNRRDKTSFLRDDPETWSDEKLIEFGEAVQKVTDTMYRSMN